MANEQIFGRKLSVTRLAVTGAVTASAIFILCWLGTYIPFSSPTHAYIGLFTTAEMYSGAALGQGIIWSVLFGALTAGVFACVYNLLSGLERR